MCTTHWCRQPRPQTTNPPVLLRTEVIGPIPFPKMVVEGRASVSKYYIGNIECLIIRVEDVGPCTDTERSGLDKYRYFGLA